MMVELGKVSGIVVAGGEAVLVFQADRPTAVQSLLGMRGLRSGRVRVRSLRAGNSECLACTDRESAVPLAVLAGLPLALPTLRVGETLAVTLVNDGSEDVEGDIQLWGAFGGPGAAGRPWYCR
jgi:hypothetical protein